MTGISTRISNLSRVSGLLGLMLVAAAGSSLAEAPLTGSGSTPMPSAVITSSSNISGYFGTPWAYYTGKTPVYVLAEAPLTGSGNTPMPTLMEAPLTGSGNTPMPTLMEAPLTGSGNTPMPPSCAVAAVLGGIAVYIDGTVGYPNGDFQFTSGAYLWADGFVRFSSAPGNYEWTNYAGVVINTTRGDVAANGLPHVEYPVLYGIL